MARAARRRSGRMKRFRFRLDQGLPVRRVQEDRAPFPPWSGNPDRHLPSAAVDRPAAADDGFASMLAGAHDQARGSHNERAEEPARNDHPAPHATKPSRSEQGNSEQSEKPEKATRVDKSSPPDKTTKEDPPETG